MFTYMTVWGKRTPVDVQTNICRAFTTAATLMDVFTSCDGPEVGYSQ